MSQPSTPVRNEEIAKLSHNDSRRRFLKAGAIVTAGLTFQWLSGCSKSEQDLSYIWEELAYNLEGTLLKPNSPGFKQKATPWALQYANRVPQGIALCVSEADISNCILWAKKHKIPFVARSGGHSYAGYSTTSGLIIDVSSMTDIEPLGGDLIRVSAGARNKNVFKEGKARGIAITHGRCFEVGVAGLVLGGGIGFDMRKNGYTCDKLVETRVVLADGSIITCNENENADLFWACRGAGGGNFGIHTSFTFKTFDVGNITMFNIKWKERIPEVFAAVQEMIKTAPDTFGLKLSISAVKQFDKSVLTLSLLGQLAGPENELKALLAPVLAVHEPTEKTIKYLPYWDAQEEISEEGAPEYAHERSRFVRGEISAAAFQTIISNLEAWPGTSKAATWKYFLLGGEIDKKAPTDMAFVHRGYTMLSSVELEWTKADSNSTVATNEVWLDDFHNQMEAHTSSYCYQNFIDPDQKDYLNAYYGQNLGKLREVKRKYDPENLFRYPQAIPL